MPELPEAETIVRGLALRTVGRRIVDVRVARPEVIKAGLSGVRSTLVGRRIGGVSRRGKRIVIHLEPDGMLIFALGMTGRLMMVPSEVEAAKHTHLILGLDVERHDLRFCDPRRFGGVWYYARRPKSGEAKPVRLGAEPTTITLPRFRELLRRGRQIKALLMDQHVLAGLGNIYCDESLHRAGVHPLSRADALDADEGKRLHAAIQKVLADAIRAGGSTINDFRNASGGEGLFQVRHRVYGREGEPCRRCGTRIIRIQVAGRSTHLCPACQQIR